MKKHKKILIFLLKFLGSYGLMVFLYVYFLNSTQKTHPILSCDPITQLVAEQSAGLLNFFDVKTVTAQNSDELSYRFLINNSYVARIVEGCNAVSVIILFVAFILAFSVKFKTTFLYIIIGSVLIYGVNIIRISFIAVAIYHFPQFSDFLHQIIFPLIIYGFTFLLWVIWINYFMPKYQK